MQLVIDLYFLSICIQLYMFRASRSHHQESLTVHTTSSFCVCVRPRQSPDDERVTLETCKIFFKAYKTVPRTDTNTETGGCMYSEGLLMMSA
jgi:hypothetical protein